MEVGGESMLVKKETQAGRVAQQVGCLPRIRKAVGPIPGIA